jgi:hypothetical protein
LVYSVVIVGLGIYGTGKDAAQLVDAADKHGAEADGVEAKAADGVEAKAADGVEAKAGGVVQEETKQAQ